MRFAGLSPINRTIRHSKVLPRLQPSAPPRSVTAFVPAAKTGPPALPLCHRRDRAPPRRDQRGHVGRTRLAEIPARPPRRKRMSRIVDLPDGHPSRAAMMARLAPLAGPTPLRFCYRHAVLGRPVASPSPLPRGCWRSSAPSATRAKREVAGGARSGPAVRHQEQGSTGPLAPARRRRPPRKGMMAAAMESRSRFPPPADTIPLQLQWL
jgi:hypothetical protein